MNHTLRSAYVIGRRDFVATVYSKAFILFLIGPLLPLAFGIFFADMSEKMARDETHPTVAVVASEAEFAPLAAAHRRLSDQLEAKTLPDLVREQPDYVQDAQVKDLLASQDKELLAVLTGGLDRPTLTGSISRTGRIQKEIALIVDEARQYEALRRAGQALAPTRIDVVEVTESAGDIATGQALTARVGQMLLLFVTMLLSGMLLSNLIEEKSNKVIEVLAAAVPVNAIFFGKLMAMLVISLVGITVWGLSGAAAAAMWLDAKVTIPAPAVGWPIFCILLLLYYSMAYLLLGALFLGIGAQASSVRDVQTISLPVTMGQLVVFLLASMAVGQYGNVLGWAAMIFPFSSPLVMLARAAQLPDLWLHLVALAWQALWVFLILRLGAHLFRRSVLKSGEGTGKLRPSRTAEARG